MLQLRDANPTCNKIQAGHPCQESLNAIASRKGYLQLLGYDVLLLTSILHRAVILNKKRWISDGMKNKGMLKYHWVLHSFTFLLLYLVFLKLFMVLVSNPFDQDERSGPDAQHKYIQKQHQQVQPRTEHSTDC